MSRRGLLFAGIALAVLATTVCLTGGLWEKTLSMDNRLYFYISERAASGVPPHVSTPDVKNQLATLTDAVSITIGRFTGLDDVRSGRLGTLVILIVGVWGVGLSVYELGATAGAAALGALSVFAFSNLVGHTIVGFNPKILLFTFLAWGPWFVARGRFAAGGAAVTAAMMCWQPGAAACLAAALGALTSSRPWRAFFACIAGGIAVFALYEAYFAWHGILLPQLFQAYALPLGSVHGEVDWLHGLRFVLIGSEHGIDRYGLAGGSFVVFALGGLAAALRLPVPSPGRAAAPAPAVVLVLVAGSVMFAFTDYEHQAEPDRFLLVAYFAIAIGVVADRLFQFARTHAGERTAFQLEGALAVVLLMCSSRRDFNEARAQATLDDQINQGRILAMMAEAYGSVWAYGCIQMMGLAHLTNYHPIDHFWDDLRRYVDEETFVPLVHHEPPDVILRCHRFPGEARLLESYTKIPVPRIGDGADLYVRREARSVSAAEELDIQRGILEHARKRRGHRRRHFKT